MIFRQLKALCVAAVAAFAAIGGATAPLAKVAEQTASAFAEARPDVLIVHVGKAQIVSLPREARDVLISDPEIVDAVLRTARQPVLFGMRIGQANVLFFDDSNREIRRLEIRVEYDADVLNGMIHDEFPNAEVEATSVLGDIVLTGRVSNSPEAVAIENLARRFVRASRISQDGASDADDAGVINRISITNEEQIHLRVRVAEVERSVLKQLGVDFTTTLESSVLSQTILLQGLPFSGEILQASNAQIDLVLQPLDTFLSALEQQTLVRTLAEPSLTAVSGETASFLAGGEFPVPVAADDDEITIEFKSFGVGLDFTPVVVGEDRLSLQIATEVSTITDVGSFTVAGFDIPGLTVRRAETTVELSSGGTIMMAGLIQQSTRRLSRGLPGLRSLPVLGAFFRDEETEVKDTELVVLVTPYTVRQNRADAFLTPTDGFAPASDLDVYLFGRLHAVYGSGDPADPAVRQQAEGLRAPVGFIVE